MRYLKVLFSLVVGIQVLALSGCGGGGGGTTGGTVVFKLATSGTLPSGSLINGITTTLNYPSNKGLAVANVVVSGVGVGPNSFVTPNTNTNGQVGIAFVNAVGIPIGEFVTLTFSVSSGFPSVTPSDFSIASGASIVDLSGSIPGISVVIQPPVVIQ